MTDKHNNTLTNLIRNRAHTRPPRRQHIQDVSRIKRGICAKCNERLPYLFERGTDYICPACDKAQRKKDRERAYGA